MKTRLEWPSYKLWSESDCPLIADWQREFCAVDIERKEGQINWENTTALQTPFMLDDSYSKRKLIWWWIL